MEHALICNNHPIRVNLTDGFDKLGQFFDVFVVGEQVQRQIDTLAVFMDKATPSIKSSNENEDWVRRDKSGVPA